MMHTDLVYHYEKLFAFQQYHHWPINVIEDLLPWEFDAMGSLLSNYLETMELERKQREANR